MSYTYLIILAALCVLPIALNYVVMFVLSPLVAWRRQTIALSPAREETTADDLTPEMKTRLGQVLGDFAATGFSAVSNTKVVGAVKNVTSFQILLVNRSRGQVGVVIATAPGVTSKRTFLYGFRTHFADGTSVTTGIRAEASAVPKDPANDAMSFPWAKDVSTLYEAHNRRVAAAGRSDEISVVPAPGDELEYVNDEWTRGIGVWVRKGHRRRDPEAGVARFTLWGACYTSWRLAPPVKKRLANRLVRRSRRVWNELGMDRWTPPGPVRVTVPIEPSTIKLPTVGDQPAGEPALHYRAEMASGQIRWNWSGGRVTIAGGNPTIGDVLAKNWVDLLLLVVLLPVFLFALELNLSMRWMLHGSGLGRSLLIVAALWLYSAFKLFKAIRRPRGVTTVTGEPGLLRYENAPARPPSGALSTDELAGLPVVLTEANPVNRRYQLIARTTDGKSLRLLSSKDRGTLDAARSELAVALGIKNRAVESELNADN
jgi:hypothetical protein